MPVIQIKGFSLIEVMVTLAITVVGLVGISSLQLQSNRAIVDSGSRSQAIWMLEELSSRINANSAALISYDTGGDYNSGNCATIPTICAAYFNSGQQKSAICTPQEVALFDIWDLTCPKTYTHNNNQIRESAADFISTPTLNIAVDAANNRATLTVTWRVRTTATNDSGEKIYIAVNNENNLTDSISRQINL